MEQREGKEDYVENQSKCCKYRSRRQRVCVVFTQWLEIRQPD